MHNCTQLRFSKVVKTHQEQVQHGSRVSEKKLKNNEHGDDGEADDDDEAGDDKPEEQQSWQVESVSLTPQHSAARPRRVMYDLKTRS